jgi:hypothetical protein
MIPRIAFPEPFSASYSKTGKNSFLVAGCWLLVSRCGYWQMFARFIFKGQVEVSRSHARLK